MVAITSDPIIGHGVGLPYGERVLPDFSSLRGHCTRPVGPTRCEFFGDLAMGLICSRDLLPSGSAVPSF